MFQPGCQPSGLWLHSRKSLGLRGTVREVGLCWGQARAKCRLRGQQKDIRRRGGRGLQSGVRLGSDLGSLEVAAGRTSRTQGRDS